MAHTMSKIQQNERSKHDNAGAGRSSHYLDPANGHILDAGECLRRYPTLDQVCDGDNGG